MNQQRMAGGDEPFGNHTEFAQFPMGCEQPSPNFFARFHEFEKSDGRTIPESARFFANYYAIFANQPLLGITRLVLKVS